MNKYAEMKERQQARINALPLMFAFSQKQFKEGMEKWGLTENDTNKIYKLGSTGGFYRREDSKLIFSTFEESAIEMQEAIQADSDGTGFIKDMFLYELANHEYCITYDLEPTLAALNLSEDDVLNDKRLLNGLKLAKAEYIRSTADY
jgi:hypothetical protein